MSLCDPLIRTNKMNKDITSVPVWQDMEESVPDDEEFLSDAGLSSVRTKSHADQSVTVS